MFPRPILKVTMSECCSQHFNLIKLTIVIIKIISIYTILSYLQYVFERFPNKLKTPLTIIYQVVVFFKPVIYGNFIGGTLDFYSRLRGTILKSLTTSFCFY